MKPLVAVAVAVAIALGLWITGALLTNDFTLSLILNAVWMAVAGVGVLALARAKRSLLLPAVAGYLIVAIGGGALFVATTLVDKTVDEDVVMASAPGTAAPGAASPGNRLLAGGSFSSLAHGTRGTAKLVRTTTGARVLTLTGFETDPGPDLRVLLTTDADQGSHGRSLDLGALKGNKGDQQYAVPGSADLAELDTVVVWCRAFSVGFGRAALRS